MLIFSKHPNLAVIDNKGVSNTITISYVVDNDPPVITNVEYPTSYIGGETFNLKFKVTDIDKLKDVTVTYFADENTSKIVNLPTDTVQEVTIYPELIGTPQDLLININATDASGNRTKTVLIYVSKEVDSYLLNLHVGEKVEDYQLISFPFVYSDPRVRVYLDELGPPSEKIYSLINSESWAIYKYQEGNNVKLSLDDEISRGVGYWLITAEKDLINLKANSLKSTFSLQLLLGWNLIGNPYPFKISWQDVLDENDQFNDQVSQHINTYRDGTIFQTNEFDPFTGGFIWSADSGVLNILALPSGSNGRTAKVQETNSEEGEWFLPISIEAGGFKNEIGGIGMRNDALEGKDRFDEYNLPRFITYVEPEFYGKDDEVKLLRNIVSVTDNYIWNLDISTNVEAGKIKIIWPEDFQADNNKFLMLYDTTTGWLIDMTKRNTVLENLDKVSGYKIIYGSKEFIEANILLNTSILRIYPIPSSGKIILDLVNPNDDSKLNYKLINLNGKTVLNGETQLGKTGSISHEIDLKEKGPDLNAGLYYLIINFNNENYVKKLLIN